METGKAKTSKEFASEFSRRVACTARVMTPAELEEEVERVVALAVLADRERIVAILSDVADRLSCDGEDAIRHAIDVLWQRLGSDPKPA